MIGFCHRPATPRRSRWIVEGAHDVVIFINKMVNLRLIPGMIAKGHHIHADGFKLLILLEIESILCMDVLAIGNDQVNGLFFF